MNNKAHLFNSFVTCDRQEILKFYKILNTLYNKKLFLLQWQNIFFSHLDNQTCLLALLDPVGDTVDKTFFSEHVETGKWS